LLPAGPLCTKVPLPVTVFAKFAAPLKSVASTAPLETATLAVEPVNIPRVPPLPSCMVPEEAVAIPVKLLLPLKINWPVSIT